MARDYDGISQRLLVADDAALSLPDGGFTLAGWIYCDAISATSRSQYFYSHGTVMDTSSCNLYISEPSGALVAYVVSDGGTSKQAGWAAGAITAATWLHICLRCTDDDLRIYINGVQSGLAQTAAWNAVSPSGSLYLGARNDLNASRFFNGKMAEWGKYNSALTDSQMTKLVLGYAVDEIDVEPVWYIKMLDGYAESIMPLSVTNIDTTDVAHPDNIYNVWPRVKVSGSLLHKPMYSMIGGELTKIALGV